MRKVTVVRWATLPVPPPEATELEARRLSTEAVTVDVECDGPLVASAEDPVRIALKRILGETNSRDQLQQNAREETSRRVHTRP